MKVLMISTDRSVFDKDSAFRVRLIEYQKRLGHITVLVIGVNKKEEVAPYLHLVGVLHKTKLGTLYVANKLAQKIIAVDPASWLVTTQDEFTGLVGFTLRRRFGIPWRAEVHTDILSPWFGRVFFKNNLRRFIFRLTIGYASCVRVVSERIKKSLERKRFVRAPIVVLSVKPRRPDGATTVGSERYFIVLSRLTYEKNIGFAIRAFKEVADVFPDILLKIVGDGPQKKQLERQASDLGIRNRIVFLGWQNDTVPLIAGAIGLISTSWYEGFGLSILEAMSIGCPVITTDVGIAGEALQDDVSGVVVEHNDVSALSEAMTHFIKEPEYRARLGAEAQKVAESFFDEDVYWRAFDESFSVCKPKN